jgi:hypothetical protein
MTFNVRRQSPAAEKSAALGIAIQSDIARQTRVVRKFQHSMAIEFTVGTITVLIAWRSLPLLWTGLAQCRVEFATTPPHGAHPSSFP